MKRSMFFGLAAVLMAQVGVAAPTVPENEAASKATAAPAAAGDASMKAGSSSSTSASSMGSLSAAKADAPASSTASLKEQIKATSPRKIKGEFWNINEFAAAETNHKTGSVASSGFAGLKYALTETQTIGLRQGFSFAYPKTGEELKMKAEDVYVNYSNSKLAAFANDGSLSLNVRGYLPTGEDSRKVTGTNGGLLTWWIASKPITKKLTLEYHLVPRWYNLSQAGHKDDAGKFVEHVNYKLTQFGALNYQISKNFSFTQWAGTVDSWYQSTAQSGKQRTSAAYFDSSVTYSGIPSLDLSLGLAQEGLFYAPGKPSYAVYRDDEMTYYFILSAAI